MARNADPSVNRSSSIGTGSGTAPFGIATVTVIDSNGKSPDGGAVNVAVSPVTAADPHGAPEPNAPAKQLTREIATGAWTVTFAASIGTVHAPPMTSQNSSSCPANPLSAPRTRYVMSYVWRPVIVRSGSPILITLSLPFSSTRYCAGVPSEARTDTTSRG